MEQIPYSVQIYDPDGIERVQIDMGVFSPVGETSWIRMYDDGTNGGDEVANDGVFTALLSVRTGTPLGTHEVQLRAIDQFGELNTTSSAIVLNEANARNRRLRRTEYNGTHGSWRDTLTRRRTRSVLHDEEIKGKTVTKKTDSACNNNLRNKSL